MNASTDTTQTPGNPIGDYLAEPLRVGEPDVSGPLAVFPIFGPEPRQVYVSFAQAREHGVRIGELDAGASVNDLMVENPTQTLVLLFDGEEVLGAQQNRTFDVSVLVAAGAKLRVPVSCVEAGRWQGARHGESFEVAPQAAYPAMRRKKAAATRQRVAAGLEARANQGEVWDEVRHKSARMGVHSPTNAMHDVYEGHRSRLGEMQAEIELHDGQLGALVAIAGEFAVLDYVSRADVFASLHTPLVQGYALDALESEAEVPTPAPAIETARGFALLATDCEPSHRNGAIGLGEELRFDANGLAGTALVHDDELVQLTAFPDEDGHDAPQRTVRGGRVRRPSRRGRS